MIERVALWLITGLFGAYFGATVVWQTRFDPTLIPQLLGMMLLTLGLYAFYEAYLALRDRDSQ